MPLLDLVRLKLLLNWKICWRVTVILIWNLGHVLQHKSVWCRLQALFSILIKTLICNRLILDKINCFKMRIKLLKLCNKTFKSNPTTLIKPPIDLLVIPIQSKIWYLLNKVRKTMVVSMTIIWLLLCQHQDFFNI